MGGRREGQRLLIYSQDGLGLGHLRRTTLLAAEFLAAQPGSSVLTVCDSPLGQFFSSAPGHEHLKLPSIRKMGPGDWSAVSLAMPFPEVLHVRREIIAAAAQTFAPDVLLVDHMPHGAMGELVPALELLEKRGTRLVLGLRDILDAPATIRQRWHLEGAFEAVERHYDEVLVYGTREVFDVSTEYAWPAHLDTRLSYCGYVCSSAPIPSRKRVRRRLLRDHPDAALVVAMAGGGADGYRLFETLVEAVPAMAAHRPVVLLVVTGPFLPAAQRARLKELAQDLPVIVRKSVPDSLTYLNAADLVVAMAGYNTTAEILSLGRRALLVPRSGPSAEQRLRASSFAARGWVHWLDPDTLAPPVLAGAVLEALEAEPVPPDEHGPDLRGRQRAVAHLTLGSPVVRIPAEAGRATAARWGEA
ncbi:MAG TPA: glycosyltransferase [Pedococcus sp.]